MCRDFLVKSGPVAATAILVAATLTGCTPEVGSVRWCEMMQETPRGDWSANDALDYGRHCLLDGRE